MGIVKILRVQSYFIFLINSSKVGHWFIAVTGEGFWDSFVSIDRWVVFRRICSSLVIISEDNFREEIQQFKSQSISVKVGVRDPDPSTLQCSDGDKLYILTWENFPSLTDWNTFDINGKHNPPNKIMSSTLIFSHIALKSFKQMKPFVSAAFMTLDDNN